MASVSCPPPPAHTSAAGPAEDAPGGGPGGGWRWGSFRASSPLLQAVTRGSASRSDNALYEHTRTAMALGDLASGVPSGGVHVSKAPAVVAHVASDRVCTASSGGEADRVLGVTTEGVAPCATGSQAGPRPHGAQVLQGAEIVAAQKAAARRPTPRDSPTIARRPEGHAPCSSSRSWRWGLPSCRPGCVRFGESPEGARHGTAPC